ncbi:MAG: hypothetical protein ACK5KT_03390 [Dysgonomonas sp.]
MKKLFYLLLIPLLFAACSSDDDNENNNQLPIENLQLPETSESAPIKNSEVITINGKGFKASDEIWFTTTTKATENSGSKKGEVQEVTETYIKVLTPDVYGKQAISLKKDGKTYNLGSIYFETKVGKKRMTKYMHANDEDHDYYAFEYNANGFLAKITDGDDDGEQDVYTLTYENNKLIKINVVEDDGEPYFFDIEYGGSDVKIKYTSLPWTENKNGTDIIKLNEAGNPVKITYQGGSNIDFTYDANGNIATLSKYTNDIDVRQDYTLSYDDKLSFISNMNLPSWFWIYDRLDMDLGCGLVNNIVKVNNKNVYSYTYDSVGYPVKIKDLDDEDDLEIEISYETF